MTATPNHALQRTPGFGVQLPSAAHPTGSVTGCAARHEARHSPRLRLAPACSQPRPRPGVAERGVVRRLSTFSMNARTTAAVGLRLIGLWLVLESVLSMSYSLFGPFGPFAPLPLGAHRR